VGLFYNTPELTQGVSVNNTQQAINMNQQKFVNIKAYFTSPTGLTNPVYYTNV